MTRSPGVGISLMVTALSAAAIGLLTVIYFTPIWWVSLTAPNYPPEAFPDGVRIHFHMNGVFNGCRRVDNVEIQEDQALDCVHEMDTINHYVGMYPIAAGAPVERGYSQFTVSMLAVMLLGFMIPWPRLRVGVMTVAFAGLIAWMYLTMFTEGGIRYENESYLAAMVMALDQGSGDEDAGAESLSAGQALIQRLRQSLADSGVESAAKDEEDADTAQKSKKQIHIDNLRVTLEKDRGRRAKGERWNGSGVQVLAWHYEKTLGRYFNNPEEIGPMVDVFNKAVVLVFWFLIGAMLLLLWGARKNGGLFYWLLVLVPMALPVFFIIDYSAWLWWFGHTMNEMGAFTVKPFMPTVFGDGKVAQFTTHSYPYTGFGWIMLNSVLLLFAALLRRKQLKPAS